MSKKKEEHRESRHERGDGTGGFLSGLTDFIEAIGNLAEAGEKLSRGHSDISKAGGIKMNTHFSTQDTMRGRTASNVNKMFGGLTDIAEKLHELSEKEESISRSGEFNMPGSSGIKGVYGFTLRTGLGEKHDRMRVEPFGNIHKDRKTGRVTVQEIREPLVDVFTEKDATILIAEMPGIGVRDVQLDVQDDLLTLTAVHGDKKYRKEILLTHPTDNEKIKIKCNNGVVEIRCPK